jgi:hypothetical protein
MPPPSEHERDARFLCRYAEIELALHTFARSLAPTLPVASEVTQRLIFG